MISNGVLNLDGRASISDLVLAEALPEDPVGVRPRLGVVEESVDAIRVSSFPKGCQSRGARMPSA